MAFNQNNPYQFGYVAPLKKQFVWDEPVRTPDRDDVFDAMEANASLGGRWVKEPGSDDASFLERGRDIARQWNPESAGMTTAEKWGHALLDFGAGMGMGGETIGERLGPGFTNMGVQYKQRMAQDKAMKQARQDRINQLGIEIGSRLRPKYQFMASKGGDGLDIEHLEFNKDIVGKDGKILYKQGSPFYGTESEARSLAKLHGLDTFTKLGTHGKGKKSDLSGAPDFVKRNAYMAIPLDKLKAQELPTPLEIRNFQSGLAESLGKTLADFTDPESNRILKKEFIDKHPDALAWWEATYGKDYVDAMFSDFSELQGIYDRKESIFSPDYGMEIPATENAPEQTDTFDPSVLDNETVVQPGPGSPNFDASILSDTPGGSTTLPSRRGSLSFLGTPDGGNSGIEPGFVEPQFGDMGSFIDSLPAIDSDVRPGFSGPSYRTPMDFDAEMANRFFGPDFEPDTWATITDLPPAMEQYNRGALDSLVGNEGIIMNPNDERARMLRNMPLRDNDMDNRTQFFGADEETYPWTDVLRHDDPRMSEGGLAPSEPSISEMTPEQYEAFKAERDRNYSPMERPSPSGTDESGLFYPDFDVPSDVDERPSNPMSMPAEDYLKERRNETQSSWLDHFNPFGTAEAATPSGRARRAEFEKGIEDRQNLSVERPLNRAESNDLAELQKVFRAFPEVLRYFKHANPVGGEDGFPDAFQLDGFRQTANLQSKLPWNDDRAIDTAFGAILEPYLRIKSGAAVPETELARYFDTYRPQMGDTAEQAALKINMLWTYFNSFRKGLETGKPIDILPPFSVMESIHNGREGYMDEFDFNGRKSGIRKYDNTWWNDRADQKPAQKINPSDAKGKTLEELME